MRSWRFSISILGSPLVRDNRIGSSLPFPEKGFALLAYLALDGDNLLARRDAVGACLWEDSHSDKAAANLRSLLARIREIQRQTGLELVDADREHVWLMQSAAVDVTRLRELAGDRSTTAVLEQCALYRGDLLDRSGGGLASSEWLLSHRAALRALFIASLATFLERVENVDAATVETAAHKLMAVDPYQEEAYRALMRLHAAAGRPRHLDGVYRDCCNRLQHDLQAAPDARTTALYRELCGLALDGDEGSRAGPRAKPAEAAPASARAERARGANVQPSICILTPPGAQDGRLLNVTAALLEDVVIGLCSQKTFSVVAPHTAWQLSPEGPDDELVGRFGIDYLMQTRIQEYGDDSFLAAKLVATHSRRVAWADRFLIGAGELARTYQSLSLRIVEALTQAVENAELERHRRDPDASAYVAFLLATRALAKVQLSDVRAARSLFKSSLNQDQRFAPAMSGVARTLVTEWLLLQRGEPDLLDEAERFARRALAQDPLSADGLRELGLCSLYRGRFDDSLAAFAEAERRAPHHADLLADHADALSLAGRSADALRKIEQAAVLNPLRPDRYRWYEGTILYQLERYDEAIRALLYMADSSPAYKLLAASWAMLGEPAEARKYAKEVRRIYPDFKVDKWLSVLPIRDAAVRQRYEQGLRTAGFE